MVRHAKEYSPLLAGLGARGLSLPRGGPGWPSLPVGLFGPSHPDLGGPLPVPQARALGTLRHVVP